MEAALARANRESADYQMVFDLVGTLAEVKGESEAVDRVLELFSLLFAPQSLSLVRVQGSEVRQVVSRPADATCDLESVRSFCAREADQSEAAGREGFRVRIGHRGETIAVVVVDRVRFPEHAEHYRRVGETVARVCGLALANARDYQKLQTTIEELTAAQANVRVLAGLLPICASCKKIRDDKGYWNQLEMYITEHTDATLTHGLCPDCTKIYFPGVVV